MNTVNILSKTIANELLMKDGYLPKYLLNKDEEDFLKKINKEISDAQAEDDSIQNSVLNILISNGETQMRIWNTIENFIYSVTKKDISELIIGTSVKYTKNPENHLYTIQWILSRLYEKGPLFKIYNPGKFKLIVGENIYFSSSLKGSIKDVDIYLDFGLYELPLKEKLEQENIIFRF